MIDVGPEMSVRIDDLVFRGGEGDTGFFIASDGFTGWEDSPDVRFDSIDRVGDGEFDTPVFYGSRTVTIAGPCYAPSDLELNQFRKRLTGLGAGVKRVTVTHQGETTFADGRLASAAKFLTTMPGRNARATYQLAIRFPDPRKYGDEHSWVTPDTTTSESLTVRQYGNFSASPRIVVHGSGDGYVINGPDGKKITVTEQLISTHDHTIDLRTGQLFVDGAAVYAQMPDSDVWAVPPGQQVTQTITFVNGHGSSTTYLRDTYI